MKAKKINTPCPSCGREDEGKWLSPCPATDECPSYFEEVGIQHPDHPLEPMPTLQAGQ